MEQLVSSCCNFSHLKGSTVCNKNMFLLSPNNLVIISPHVMGTIVDLLLLSRHQVIAFALMTGGPHPFTVILAGSSYRCLSCV